MACRNLLRSVWRKPKRWVLLLPLLVACAHRPRPEVSKSLFPPGNYQHHIDVQITKTKLNFQFTGVVGLSETNLKIYMMGPMNISAVKMSENFADGNVRIENYFAQFKPYERSLSRFYEILRSLILFPRDQENWGALKVTARDSQGLIRRLQAPHDIQIEIKKYKDTHPIAIELHHSQFDVTIEETAP